MKVRKRIGLVLVACLLACLSLAAAASTSAAEEQSVEARLSAAMTYDGLSARLHKENSGIRSVYSVDMAAVKALENEGYTVAFGAVMGVGTYGGVEYNTTNGLGVSTDSIAADKTFAATGEYPQNAKAVTVYATKDNALGIVGSELYTAMSAARRSFAYTTVYSDASETRDMYENAELVYTGFIAAEKDGTWTVSYTRASGKEFASDESPYGLATSVYEVSHYFLNTYRGADNTLTESPYADNARLRAIVSTVGVTVPEVSAGGGAAVVEAVEGESLETVVATAGAHSIRFSADNLAPGVYKLLFKANYGDKKLDVYVNANNRVYTARTNANAGSTAGGAVAWDADFVDFGLHAYLDAGQNSFSVYTGNSGVAGTSQPLGIAEVKLVLVEEKTAGTVHLTPEDVDEAADSHTYGAGANGAYAGTGSFKHTAFIQNGYLAFRFTVPTAGKYRIGAMMTAASTSVKMNIYSGTDTTASPVASASHSYNATALKPNNLSFGVVYDGENLGTHSLAAGDYTMTLGTGGQFAVADIFLVPVKEPKVTDVEGDKSFTVTTADMTHSDATATVENGVYTMDAANETLTFTVENADAGVYKLVFNGHASYSGKWIGRQEIYATVNAHQFYLGSAPHSVKDAANETKEIAIRENDPFYFELDAGTNQVTLKFGDATAQAPFYFGDFTLEQVFELTPDTVKVSRGENLVSAGTAQKNAGNDAFYMDKDQYATYTVNIPKSGTYHLSGLMMSLANCTPTFSFKANGAEVLSQSITFHKNFKAADWTKATLYADGMINSDFALEAGVYELTVTASSQFCMNNFYFTPVATTGEEGPAVEYGTETLAPVWNAGKLTADGIASEADAYYSNLLHIAKAGTVVEVSVPGAVSGHLGTDAYLVAAYKLENGSYMLDPDSAYHILSAGYASGTGVRASGGRLIYTVTTIEDDVFLRIGGKTHDTSSVTVTAFGEIGSAKFLSVRDEVALFVEHSKTEYTGVALSEVQKVTVIGTPSALGKHLSYTDCGLVGMLTAKYPWQVKTVSVSSFAEANALSGIPSDCGLVLIFAGREDYDKASASNAYESGVLSILTAVKAAAPSATVVSFSAPALDSAQNGAGMTAADYAAQLSSTVKANGAFYIDTLSLAELGADGMLENGLLTVSGAKSLLIPVEKAINPCLPSPYDMKIPLSSMSYGDGVTMLSDGTLYVPIDGTEPAKNAEASSVRFTVTVKKAGVYYLYGKHNSAGGFTRYVSLSTSKGTPSACGAVLGTKDYDSFAGTAEDFRVSLPTAKSDKLAYIYLPEGEQTLTLCVAGKTGYYPLGIGDLELRAVGNLEADSVNMTVKETTDKVISNMAGGGALIRAGQATPQYLKFSFTVPSSGYYKMSSILTGQVDNGCAASFAIDGAGTYAYAGTIATGYSTSHSGFGDISAPGIEQDIADGILLLSGKTYTLTVEATKGYVTVSNIHLEKTGDVADETVVTPESITLGSTVDASFTVTGVRTEPMLCLAYDRGGYLIGSQLVEKTADLMQTVTFRFTPTVSREVTELRVLQIADTETYTPVSDMWVKNGDFIATVPLGEYEFTRAHATVSAVGSEYDISVALNALNTTGGTILADGTVLLKKGAPITFTVNAKTSGVYYINFKYNRGEGYVHYLYVRNKTAASWWGGEGQARLGKSGEKPDDAITDEDYAVGHIARYNEYEDVVESAVWLNAGDNTIELSLGGGSLNTHLGLAGLRFNLEKSFEVGEGGYGNNVILPYNTFKNPPTGYTNNKGNGGSFANNGLDIRSGGVAYMSVTVPVDGAYSVYAFMSSDGAAGALESPEASFCSMPLSVGVIKTGGCSTTVLLENLTTLQLTAGTHVIALRSASGIFHFNLLMLEYTGELDPTKCIQSEMKGTVDEASGGNKLNVTVTASGLDMMTDKNTPTVNKKLAFYATYQNKDGAITVCEPIVHEINEFGAVYDFVLDLSEYETVTYHYTVTSADGLHTLYASELATYSNKNSLNVYLLTDTHYTGGNEAQNIATWNKNTDLFESWGMNEAGVKQYNNYTAEYDIYGWTSDEKLQRIMDDLIMRYKNGELDMVFILGDVAMNDGNYANFASDNVKYHTGQVYVDAAGNKLPTSVTGFTTGKNTHYGRNLNDFWDNPLNVSYIVREKFINQLSAAGIPVFLANGNHDYQYGYKYAVDENGDIIYDENGNPVKYVDENGSHAYDFTAWEEMYHYAELFGHRDENGYYTDATSSDYLIRVVRDTDGKIRILSALSTAELAQFKIDHANDGNCYTHFMSEEEFAEKGGTMLAAFIMGDGFLVDSYDFYMDYHITQEAIKNDDGTYSKGAYSYVGQTVRFRHFQEKYMLAMAENAVEYPSVYFVSHMLSSSDPTLNKIISLYPNIKGCFYGDVHNEDHYYGQNNIPFWVVGYYSSDYDIDEYFVRNADGTLSATPDNQYYYDRGTTKIANKIWGDFTRHPFANMVLHVRGSYSYAERMHMGAFYEEGWQERLTFNWLRGWDKDYTHATFKDLPAEVQATLDENSFVYFNKGTANEVKLYVGGYVGTVGQSWAYVVEGSTKDLSVSEAETFTAGSQYAANTYNKPVYYLSGLQKTDTSGVSLTVTLRDLEGNIVMNGDTPVTFTMQTSKSLNSKYIVPEGTSFVYNGETYYVGARIGGLSGGYLYDMNGDYVRVTNDGKIALYNFAYNEADGSHVKKYGYMKKDGSYEIIGTMKNEIIEKNGEKIIVGKLYDDDGNLVNLSLTEDDIRLCQEGDADVLKKCQFAVTDVNVTITDGVIICGEGFLCVGYDYTFTNAADGSAIDAGTLRIETARSNHQSVDSEVTGLYVPRELYLKEWMN